MTNRSMTYEPGMRISLDPHTHKVMVAFRGRTVELPWRCDTREQAAHAGEAYCWQRGWRPSAKATAAAEILTHH